MVDMIRKSWQLTKILYNSGPHFTWLYWKFLEKFFIFFNPFPTDIFSLFPSQGWWLFSIFRFYLWRNTQRYIENNVCSSKKKSCTLLSMIFLCYLLGPDSSESREHKMATKYSFKSNQSETKIFQWYKMANAIENKRS